MRNPLNKTLKKELMNHLTRYLSIGIVMMIMISAVSGFLSVVYSAKDILYENQETCFVEDGQVSLLQPLNDETLQKLEKEPLHLYENFYSEQKLENQTTLRVYQQRTHINLLTVYEGRLPLSKDEIALDRLFAIKNQYAINDTILLNQQALKIVGYVCFPDYTSLIEKNSDLMMDPIHFGVAVVNDEQFAKLSEKNVSYQYSYILNDSNASEKENYDQLDKLKELCLSEGYQITNMMTRQMNQAISFLPNDMGGDIPMIQVLFYIILIILAFMFVVISQAMIEEQSTVIGTLMASGYTKYELMIHYLMIPMMIVIVSAIIGNILGYYVMPPIFSRMYYNSYCLPPLQLHFNLEAFMMTTLIPVLVMLVVNFIMLLRQLRFSPLRFLRKDFKKEKKTRYIHLKNASFINRYRTRVILQNKGSYLVLFIGVIFASFIFMFGLVVSPSIDRYLTEMTDSIHSDYQYILKMPVEADGEKVTMISLETYFDAGGLDLDVSLYGLNENSDYYDDITLPQKMNEIVISSDLAKKMFLEKGQKMTLFNPYTEQSYTLTIQDIYEDHAGFRAYMSQKNLNRLLKQDEDYFNGYFSYQPLDIDENFVQSTMTKDDYTKIGEQMTEVFSQMIPIMTTIALIIYFIVIYILTKLVLDRNAHDMSFLKVMGYESQEISRIYLHATVIIVIIALLISLPICEYGLKTLFIVAFTRFTGYFEVYVPISLYGLVLMAGFITYAIVSIILTKQIQHIELGESLKETQ